MSKRTIGDSHLDLTNFEFDNATRVDVALSLLSEDFAVRFLKMMFGKNPQAFLKLVHRNRSASHVIQKRLHQIIPDGVMATLTVTRTIVGNDSVKASSDRFFCVSEFTSEKMADLILDKLKAIYSDREFLGNIRVTIIVKTSGRVAEELEERLMPFGYVFSHHESLTANEQVFMATLRNWPIFVIQPELFSGRLMAKTNVVFMFQEEADLRETAPMELRMALEGCDKAVMVFPNTESGLRALADHHADVKFVMPIRI